MFSGWEQMLIVPLLPKNEKNENEDVSHERMKWTKKLWVYLMEVYEDYDEQRTVEDEEKEKKIMCLIRKWK